MEANANTPSISSVVNDYRKLEVDDYQRTFAWDSQQIQDFFLDLQEATNTGTSHFFGSLILQTEGNGTAGVVDGQQRLTTTFLTVAALRDAALNLPDDTIQQPGRIPIRVADIAWNFLIPDNDPTVPRFWSNKFLRKILLECVLPVPEKQANIPDRDIQLTLRFRKAIRQIRELVRRDVEGFESNEAKLVRIHEMLTTLTKKFLVLRVVTESIDESLDIFLTLNNRGLPLGPSDLVRGEIMSTRGAGLEARQQQKLHQQIFEEWRVISDNVEEPEVFLRHYLVATGDKKVTKKKVVETVTERIKDEKDLRSKPLAEKFWKDLIEASEVYGRIINPGYETDFNYHMHILETISKSHRIFLLGLLRSDGKQEDIEVATRLLYVLGFRYVMSGLNAQKLEDFFQKLCGQMREGTPLSRIHQLLRDMIDETTVDVPKYLKSAGDNIGISRAILHGINRYIAPSAYQYPLDSKIHLEHIAPQGETDHWLADVFSGNTDLYDDYSDVVSEAGNFTLLDKTINLEVKQKPFAEKKAEYEKSGLYITRHLVPIQHWRLEQIEARTDWVVECFEFIWHSKPVSGKPETFNEWYSMRF